MVNRKVRRIGVIFLRVHDRLCDGGAHVSAWLMLAMALIISYEVVVRYFFDRPTIWVVDFSDYIMLYSTFFVSAWLLKHDGHIRLTILLEYLSPRSQRIIDTINSFIGAAVCGFVMWYGVADVLDAVDKSIVLPRPIPVPKSLILGVIPFGCLLLFVQFLRKGFKILASLKDASKGQIGNE